MKVNTKQMEMLSNFWYDACLELWGISKDRPFIRESATMWDAFRYAYMKLVEPEGKGRRSQGNNRRVLGE